LSKNLLFSFWFKNLLHTHTYIHQKQQPKTSKRRPQRVSTNARKVCRHTCTKANHLFSHFNDQEKSEQQQQQESHNASKKKKSRNHGNFFKSDPKITQAKYSHNTHTNQKR